MKTGTLYLQAGLDAVRQIKTAQQYGMLRFPKVPRELLCDIFTASAILAVYEALNDQNKAKCERMLAASPATFQRIAEFCLQRASPK